MATKQGIYRFLAVLQQAGLMAERKGAPRIATDAQREALADTWHTLLPDLSDVDLQAALANYLRDPACCDWYPQPGKILMHAPGRRGEMVDNADELWGIVLEAIRSVGYYQTPEWKGPYAEELAAGIAALGGWVHLCSTLKSENMAAERASFRAVARAMQQRKQLERAEGPAAALIGDLVGGHRMFPPGEPQPPPSSYSEGYDHAPDGVDYRDQDPAHNPEIPDATPPKS